MGFQDCFFVAVVIRDLPELQDKPVAICHSDNPKGTAEISSANYPAREYGCQLLSFCLVVPSVYSCVLVCLSPQSFP